MILIEGCGLILITKTKLFLTHKTKYLKQKKQVFEASTKTS